MRLCHGSLLVFLAACGSSTSYSSAPPPPPPPPAMPPPPPAPGTVIVTIADYQYASDTITIAKGTPVRWNNGGPSGHTVTSDGGVFDSGTLAGPGTDAYGAPTPGAQYTRVFSTEGTFAYHCKLHLGMNGAVIVTP